MNILAATPPRAGIAVDREWKGCVGEPWVYKIFFFWLPTSWARDSCCARPPPHRLLWRAPWTGNLIAKRFKFRYNEALLCCSVLHKKTIPELLLICSLCILFRNSRKCHTQRHLNTCTKRELLRLVILKESKQIPTQLICKLHLHVSFTDYI